MFKRMRLLLLRNTWGWRSAPSSMAMWVNMRIVVNATGEMLLVSSMSALSLRSGSPRMCPVCVRSALLEDKKRHCVSLKMTNYNSPFSSRCIYLAYWVMKAWNLSTGLWSTPPITAPQSTHWLFSIGWPHFRKKNTSIMLYLDRKLSIKKCMTWIWHTSPTVQGCPFGQPVVSAKSNVAFKVLNIKKK